MGTNKLMNKFIVIAVILLAGCESEPTYLTELRQMPTVRLTHETEAIAIVSVSYGIDAGQPLIHWTLEPLPQTAAGEFAAGVTFECESWVSWWSDYSLSGASKDGPTISATALAHEMAHCALYLLYGDGDSKHTNKIWWGANGMVELGNNALLQAGL